MRPSWKLYALECLYLLICNIAACVAAMVQCIGKSYQGEHSSFIFSGSTYSYNPFAYILGLVLFIGALYAGYRLILRRTMDELGRAGALYVVVWLVIAAVFAVVTCRQRRFVSQHRDVRQHAARRLSEADGVRVANTLVRCHAFFGNPREDKRRLRDSEILLSAVKL